MLEAGIGQPLEIHWVQGPFSQKPDIPEVTKHQFILHQAPKGLDSLINACDWVLTVHGISVFETLMYGRVCVVFNPYCQPCDAEMSALKSSGYVVLADNAEQAIALLKETDKDALAYRDALPSRANPVDGLGAFRLIVFL